MMLKPKEQYEKKPLMPTVPFFWILALLATAFAGCSTLPDRIQGGTWVNVHYTCRLADGSVLTTTDPQVADQDEEAKSDVFVNRHDYAPARIEAGSGFGGVHFGALRFFESEIRAQLSREVVGMIPGQPATLRLNSPDIKDMPTGDRYLTLSRISWLPKRSTVSLNSIANELGHTPQVGERFVWQENKHFEVLAMDDETVELKMFVKEGDIVSMPLGKARIHDDGDRYRASLEITVGQLYRVGALLGKITRVNDKEFVVDFIHPYGGEELVCQVVPELGQVEADRTTQGDDLKQSLRTE